ncbi:hypothetical protein TNCV_4710541 [Trichonephila clavipes]|uniref:Uncharacterized protein n=1 Tax=Trichonephila clavipes TaxID=2585209 RepID=A0A8X6RZK1_TRICX|nr:hypothetical protein TNCV_4710541 [Trichonephila clavipes]
MKIIPVDIFHIPQRKNPELTSPTDGLFIGVLCKTVSLSVIFVFTMNALPDHFLSATDPVSRNRSPKCVVVDAIGDFSPGYSC